jgi:hypothetical protein
MCYSVFASYVIIFGKHADGMRSKHDATTAEAARGELQPRAVTNGDDGEAVRAGRFSQDLTGLANSYVSEASHTDQYNPSRLGLEFVSACLEVSIEEVSAFRDSVRLGQCVSRVSSIVVS